MITWEMHQSNPVTLFICFNLMDPYLSFGLVHVQKI
jgi:hypothetical protein